MESDERDFSRFHAGGIWYLVQNQSHASNNLVTILYHTYQEPSLTKEVKVKVRNLEHIRI